MRKSSVGRSIFAQPVNNLQYLTSITVRIRQGQHERLDQKLDEIRTGGKHFAQK